MNRVCDNCGVKLAGRKGHGFVRQDGKSVVCGYCFYPENQKYRDAFIQKTFGVANRTPARRASKTSAERPPWKQPLPASPERQ